MALTFTDSDFTDAREVAYLRFVFQPERTVYITNDLEAQTDYTADYCFYHIVYEKGKINVW